MPGVSAVIFDLDDTLYPERAYAFSGFAAVAEAFADRLGDAGGLAGRMRRLFDTAHRRCVFNVLLEELARPADLELVNSMIEVYRAHRPRIALHLDADRSLRRLAGRFKLGLISDGPAAQQGAKIEALGLRPRFDEVILTDALGEALAKPHPAAFLEMASRLAVAHRACVYVGDNAAKDFVAPNQLGWLTVRVLRADGFYRDAPPAIGGEAGRDIASLDELDSILG